MVVISPSNKRFLGDHLENNDTQHTSTNEKVIIDEEELEDGEYKIHVFGGNYIDVPYSPHEKQMFAVVASGPIKNGYIEFTQTDECLCDKCDPEHPGNCVCDEDKYVGPFCQVNIEIIKSDSAKFTVGPLRIKRIKFVSDGIITSVVSRSANPGRDTTVWIAKKCHLIPAEYEMNGQTGNLTSGDEKRIMVNFDSNEICVAIFNINDAESEYNIEITSEGGSDESSQVSVETDEIPTTITDGEADESSQIIIETDEIPTSITSDGEADESSQISIETDAISTTTINGESGSDESSTTSATTMTSKAATETSQPTYTLSETSETINDSNDDYDSGKSNKGKNKTTIIIVSVIFGLLVAISIVIVVFVCIKKRCLLYNKYKREFSSALLTDNLIKDQ